MYNLRLVWKDGHESNFEIPENHVGDVYRQLILNSGDAFNASWPDERSVLMFSWPEVRALSFSEEQ